VLQSKHKKESVTTKMKPKKKAKSASKVKNITLKFRTNQMNATRIQARANYFFKGNLSAFIRYCVENFRKP